MAAEAVTAARQASVARASANNLAARSAVLVDHHRDSENPDKPLFLLIPSGAVAVLGLVWAIWSAYLGIMGQVASGAAWIDGLLGLVAYLGGVLLFSYGYELYDWKKALPMAVKLALAGIAILFIAVVIFLIIAAATKSRSKSRLSFGSDSKSSSSRGGNPVFLIGRVFNWATNRGVVNVNAGRWPSIPLHGTAPGTCSFCTRPLPPPGTPVPPAAVADPQAFCPKCGQPFEPAGERARSANRGAE